MIKSFPGRTADPDITHQADGAIGKALAYIADEAVVAVGVEVWASEGRLGHRVEAEHRFCPL